MPSPGGRLGFWFRPSPSSLQELDCAVFPSFVPLSSNGYMPFSSYPGAIQLTSTSSPRLLTNFIDARINNSTANAIGCFSTIKFSAAGDGTFPANDFVRPGTPWEGYGLLTMEKRFLLEGQFNHQYIRMSNSGGASGNIIDVGIDFDRAELWQLGTNHYAAFIGQENRGYLIAQMMALPDERCIRMNLSYTNTTNIGKFVYVMRGLDPDQAVYGGGSYATNNNRGLNNIVPVKQITHAQAVNGSQRSIIAIVNQGGAFDYNTAIIKSWPDSSYNINSWINSSDTEGTNDWAIIGCSFFGFVQPNETKTACLNYVFDTTLDGILHTVKTILTT